MYIGDKKIARAPESNDRVTVYFEDDTEATFTKRMFEAMKTEEPIDATGLRDRYCQVIAGDVLKVLLDWDIIWKDYQAIDTLVRLSLQEHVRSAEEKLWTKPLDKVRLSDINKAKGIEW
jgi:hypothetical protein